MKADEFSQHLSHPHIVTSTDRFRYVKTIILFADFI